MRKLIFGLMLFFLTGGSCALAQSKSSNASFPSAGFLQFPPHFQPRSASATDKVDVAPPPLPSYAQPAIPEEGYLWMPGFWAWRRDVPDYYWVPGTWVKPPRAGLQWTPPFWSRADGRYAFHAGYWAETVGFYGGIDYGYGYTGSGYRGGRWQNGTFFYNSAANNFGSVSVAHTYDQAVASDDNAGRASFNGGSRGTKARPTPDQEKFARETHAAPTAEQLKQFEIAAKDRSLYSKLNGGEPGIAATSRAGLFDSQGVTRSSERANIDAPAGGGTNVK
ncbi:YXWGXW repeat-containing protein [Bradyrhizobium sp.]|uniref:YXWGXW repeat-containing protein n=1 Tax=Bradyrhizobium sp. TaxID=376 RepID=UPI0026348EA4|nr:YXWGXW repeat-containing protein [Bradyrhizobium sp.]